MIMKRNLVYLFCMLLATTAWTGCDKDDDDQKTEDSFKINGTASGSQEVPAVTTSATGTVTGTYHTENKLLEYTVTWNNLSANPAAMHFHGPAPAGTNAGVMIPITDFTAATTGSKSGTATLTPAQDSALLNGAMYYNVHTSNNPGGEMRAQLTATAD